MERIQRTGEVRGRLRERAYGERERRHQDEHEQTLPEEPAPERGTAVGRRRGEQVPSEKDHDREERMRSQPSACPAPQRKPRGESPGRTFGGLLEVTELGPQRPGLEGGARDALRELLRVAQVERDDLAVPDLLQEPHPEFRPQQRRVRRVRVGADVPQPFGIQAKLGGVRGGRGRMSEQVVEDELEERRFAERVGRVAPVPDGERDQPGGEPDGPSRQNRRQARHRTPASRRPKRASSGAASFSWGFEPTKRSAAPK